MSESENLRILWVTRNCLFDPTSGASQSARQMLQQLSGVGFDVKAIGASTFDTAIAYTKFFEKFSKPSASNTAIGINDGPLHHTIVPTIHYHPDNMTLRELQRLVSIYKDTLTTFKPDIVWMYGGMFYDQYLQEIANKDGCKTAFYLVNGNYKGHDWYENIDTIITDSNATADYYAARLSLDLFVAGKFVPKASVTPAHRKRTHLTIINPSPEKGGYLVAQIALELEKCRPDIPLEIVESRGKWSSCVNTVLSAANEGPRDLTNVQVTGTTSDMRPIYGRARVILHPSLWYESGSRVLVEATLNGIPAIITKNGGQPEIVGKGGIILDLPADMYEAPYSKLLGREGLEKVISLIQRLFDDDDFYHTLAKRAAEQGNLKNNIDHNTKILAQHFKKLVLQ